MINSPWNVCARHRTSAAALRSGDTLGLQSVESCACHSKQFVSVSSENVPLRYPSPSLEVPFSVKESHVHVVDVASRETEGKYPSISG